MGNAILFFRAIVWASAISLISSVITNIRPEATFASLNNFKARSMAGAKRLPGAGMISGATAGIISAMVFASSVSGETVCASPEYTINPVTPSFLRLRRSSILRLALTSRFGFTSVAYIERVRSISMTRASSRSCTGCGVFCQTGPANAVIASNQASNASTSGLLELDC